MGDGVIAFLSSSVVEVAVLFKWGTNAALSGLRR